MSAQYKVLFVCKDNSSRSIMAQALLNHKGRGRFRAFSVGIHSANAPSQDVFVELESDGVPAEGLTCTTLSTFLVSYDAAGVDFVIVLCDRSEGEVCPSPVDLSVTAQWDIPDPAAGIGGSEEVKRRVHEAFVLIDRRINLLLALQDSELRCMADEQKR